MMWWKSQNLDKSITDKSGQTWHFAIWHDQVDGVYTQRIFFWNHDKSETGQVKLVDSQTLHISRIKQKIKKMALKWELREKYLCELEFPLERHY